MRGGERKGRTVKIVLVAIMLIASFILVVWEGREKKAENARLHQKLDLIRKENAESDEKLQQKVTELVAQGRLSKEDAERLIMMEGLALKEDATFKKGEGTPGEEQQGR